MVLGASRQEYAAKLPHELAGGARDRDFVLNDLTPIPAREGVARSSHIDHQIQMGVIDGEQAQLILHFFTCRHFDTEHRRCMNYENRPPICRDYPWTNGVVDPNRGLPLECEFRRDVGEVPVPFVRKS